MTKNTIGGKKFKKGKKTNTQVTRNFPQKSDFPDSENFFYAKVISILGGKNVTVLNLELNKEMLGIISGKMYKKEWLKKDDVLLCSNRIGIAIEDKKCDIIFRYSNDELKILKRLSEIKYHESFKNDFVNSIFYNQENESEEITNVEPQKEYKIIENEVDEIDDKYIDEI